MQLKKYESIILYYVWFEMLKKGYSTAEIGQMMLDLYAYSRDGIEPPEYPDRGMRSIWELMKDGVDKNKEKVNARREQNRKAAEQRYTSQSNADACVRMQTHANACIRNYMDMDTDMETDTESKTKKPSPSRGAKTPPAREEPVWEDL